MNLTADYQSLAFATQFAVDKIVGVYRDSFNAATQTTVVGGYLYQYAMPHNFTRPVFCELLWSIDGITYADGGSGLLSGFPAIAYSDSSNIYITSGISTGIIYYKLIASWIDQYDSTDPLIEPVINTTNGFYFDSRKNYQKILRQAPLTLTGTSGTLSYIHGLGYAPNAKVFFESIPGQVWPSIAGGTNDFFLYDFNIQYECAATMTTSVLNMELQGGPSSTSCRVWYRIYRDT